MQFANRRWRVAGAPLPHRRATALVYLTTVAPHVRAVTRRPKKEHVDDDSIAGHGRPPSVAAGGAQRIPKVPAFDHVFAISLA
jgi:hypothetical protein